MIVTITGNVEFPITLDPTVWIFDDRKIIFGSLFSASEDTYDEDDQEIERNLTDEEKYAQTVKPPVNKSINRFEREQILKYSYAMSLSHFIEHAEVHSGATNAILETNHGPVEVKLEQIKTSYLLFSLEGKPLKDDGPVHVYFKDGSNKDFPITGVKKIVLQ